MLDFFALPEVAQCLATRAQIPQGQVMSNVPVTTRKNVYIHPWQLDMSEEAKYGVNGKWPSNVAIRAHFSSVVHKGFESEREALEVKFPDDLVGSGKPMPLFCVQYIDGHAKAIMVLAIFALLDHLVSCQTTYPATCKQSKFIRHTHTQYNRNKPSHRDDTYQSNKRTNKNAMTSKPANKQ